MSDQNLSTGEFQRAMKALERSINVRFDTVDERLTELQEQREKQSERIAVLEAASPNNKKTTTLSVIVATITAGVVAGLKSIFVGH